MRSPNAVELLNAWEAAGHCLPARRALDLLMALSDEGQAAAELSAGERDRRLLATRQQLFGDRVEGLVDCPHCGARVETAFRVADLIAGDAERSAVAPLEFGDVTVQWRLPRSGELAELEEAPPGGDTAAGLREALWERCLIEVRQGDQPLSREECPANVLQQVSQAMWRADPLADIQLEASCPDCRATWSSRFDIGAFFWRELDQWARRLLREVHCLASAYGWSEREVVLMSPHRRQVYLEMLGA